jgi:hypothetical protein
MRINYLIRLEMSSEDPVALEGVGGLAIRAALDTVEKYNRTGLFGTVMVTSVQQVPGIELVKEGC